MTAMTLISTITAGAGGAAQIDFLSIPQTGKDLLLLTSLRTTRSELQDNFYMMVNNTSSTNYNKIRLTGYNTAVQSSSETGSLFWQVETMIPGNLANANTFGSHASYFANYSGSARKTVSFDGAGENNANTAAPGMAALQFSSTAAITSISLLQFGGNFAQGSTASLYIIS